MLKFMLKERLSISVMLLVSCLSSLCYAEIDLFDSNRGSRAVKKEPVKIRPEIIASPEKKIINLTLVGISQTGTTVLYFKDRSNKQIRLVFDKQKTNNLPGYNDLVIKTIKNRGVIINDTNNQYCKDNKSMGISCQADNHSIEMTLVRKYIPKSRTALQQTNRRVISRTNSAGSTAQGTQRNAIHTRAESKRRSFPRSKPSSSRARRVIKTPFVERSVPR